MSRFKILVLEDDPQMRSILQQVLEEQDYDVVAVDRGEKAIDAARDHSFDLIIADIRMEGVGGLEAIAQTKAVQPSIGTLIVSGYADPDETERAKQLQIGGYLKKPFKMSDFLLYVRTQLSERARVLAEGDGQSEEEESGTDSVALVLECLDALDKPKKRVPAGSFKRVTELVDSLGKEVGIVAEVRREIVAACGFILCVGAEIDVESWVGPPEQLAAFRSVLAFYEESYESDPQPPLEARLAALVLTAVRCESDVASVWSLPNLAKHKATVEELSQETPHVDPELIEVYLRSLKEDKPTTKASLTPRQRDQRERTLFMLARTLERAGDQKEANKAYQTIIERHAGTRESIESRLAMARANDGKHGKSLREACREASKLGPVTAALTALEAGHLLFKSKDPEAKEFLVGAARSLEKLGLEGALARAAIPLVSLGVKFPVNKFPRLVRALTSPEEEQEMRENAPWLLPILFRSLPDSPAEELYALLGQLVDRFGTSLTTSFRDGKFDVDSSAHLIESIRVGCRQVPEDLVQMLIADDRQEVADKAEVLKERLGDTQDQGSMIRIRSFGVLEVSVGEEEVSGNMWKTQKAKFFFAFLAARWGRAVPEETVRDLFWPKNAEKGRKNVYWATSIVRRCLRGDGESNSDIEVLERQGETLRLHPEAPRWHDLEEFVRLLAKAQKLEKDGKAAAARPLYRRLTRLYRGPYLEGCYMDWAVRYRESLERQVVDALVRLAVLALEAKEYKESVEAVEQALGLDPCRQDAAAIGMKALTESSQPEKAVEMFQKVEKSLRVDFALEPNTELIELLYRARLGAPGSSGGLIG